MFEVHRNELIRCVKRVSPIQVNKVLPESVGPTEIGFGVKS